VIKAAKDKMNSSENDIKPKIIKKKSKEK